MTRQTMSRRTIRRRVLQAAVAAAVATAAAPASAELPKPNKPDSFFVGRLAAAWWSWAISIPQSVNPLVVADGDSALYCGVGQSGTLWYTQATFLGGKAFDSSGDQFTRSCTVPEGTDVFFPVISFICTTLDGLTTKSELDSCAKEKADAISAMSLKIVDDADTTTSRTYSNRKDFRQKSHLFGVIPPPDNVVGLPADGTFVQGAADGNWIWFRKIKAGPKVNGVATAANYTITATASAPGQTPPEQSFVLKLTVLPALKEKK